MTLASACTFGRLSDLESSAPAVRVAGAGDIHSASFGDDVVGVPLTAAAQGGTVFASGNGSAALSSVSLDPGGIPTLAQSTPEKVSVQLENPTRIEGLGLPRAEHLSANGITGPFAYVASGGTVRVVDVNAFNAAATLRPSSTWGTAVVDFGLSVTGASLGPSQDDLAVGARGGLVLFATLPGAWPQIDGKPAILAGGTDWPSGPLTAVTAGDLGAGKGTDAVVAGAPAEDAVVIVASPADCFTTPSCAFTRLLAPDGAKGFGSALLIADVDGDGKNELVVGASGSRQVFVYALASGDLDPGSRKLSAKRTLSQADLGFGAALAFGAWNGGAPLLIVGAPQAVVGNAGDAGRLYLYRQDGTPPPGREDGLALVNPRPSDLLGRRLTTLPFRGASGAVTPLLVASGHDAVYIFFSNLVPGLVDPRKR